MTEPTTLGADLRRERERRGLALKSISESTKLSIALLEGLEGDDISKWPGGIFRRAFVRAYAQCVGLDADDVIRRFERQFPPEGTQAPDPTQLLAANGRSVVVDSSGLVARAAVRHCGRPHRGRRGRVCVGGRRLAAPLAGPPHRLLLRGGSAHNGHQSDGSASERRAAGFTEAQGPPGARAGSRRRHRASPCTSARSPCGEARGRTPGPPAPRNASSRLTQRPILVLRAHTWAGWGSSVGSSVVGHLHRRLTGGCKTWGFCRGLCRDWLSGSLPSC